MATLIKRPDCGIEFPLEDALNDELKGAIEKEKQDLNQQMLDHKKNEDEEVRRKEEEFHKQRQLQEDEFTRKLEAEIKEKIRRWKSHCVNLYMQTMKTSWTY